MKTTDRTPVLSPLGPGRGLDLYRPQRPRSQTPRGRDAGGLGEGRRGPSAERRQWLDSRPAGSQGPGPGRGVARRGAPSPGRVDVGHGRPVRGRTAGAGVGAGGRRLEKDARQLSEDLQEPLLRAELQPVPTPRPLDASRLARRPDRRRASSPSSSPSSSSPGSFPPRPLRRPSAPRASPLPPRAAALVEFRCLAPALRSPDRHCTPLPRPLLSLSPVLFLSLFGLRSNRGATIFSKLSSFPWFGSSSGTRVPVEPPRKLRQT